MGKQRNQRNHRRILDLVAGARGAMVSEGGNAGGRWRPTVVRRRTFGHRHLPLGKVGSGTLPEGGFDFACAARLNDHQGHPENTCRNFRFPRFDRMVQGQLLASIALGMIC